MTTESQDERNQRRRRGGHNRKLHKIILRDGRKLRYLIGGPIELEKDPTKIAASCLPVIFAFHGMYLSGHSLLQKRASSAYVVIAVNRAGYHGSSHVKIGRFTYRDFALDIKEVADSLGIQQFGCIGHSSGGPNTLACAAILGSDRVKAFATLASDPEYAAFEDGFGNDFCMDCCIGKWLPRTLAVILPCIQVSNGMRNDYEIERLKYPFDCTTIQQPG